MRTTEKEKILCGDYVRLSREDGDKPESDSIRNQKDLIADFHRRHPEMVSAGEYVDDGYSGTDFDRPGFKRMVEDAAAGKISCIIVKDLSRLGRNYIETGRYLERIFPSMGIRFIAINDHYDSEDKSGDSDSIIIPFKNLINDAYCRDISIKIRSQLDVKRKNGQFVGSFAGYGYRKDPSDKNRLVVDRYAANVVKQIFQWRIEGNSSLYIARKLDAAGILPPSEYKRQCGLNYSSGFRSGAEQKWSAVAVDRILKNEMYVGTMVQGKHRKINYKIKQSVDVDSGDWIRIDGTHEAIIPWEVFEQVQMLMERDTRIAPNHEKIYLFSGFLRCGGCGQNMVRRSVSRKGKKYNYYYCSTHKNRQGCTPHNVSEEIVEKSVLSAIRAQADLLVKAEKIISHQKEMLEKNTGKKPMEEQILKLEAEETRYEDLRAHLYEDLQDGLIGRDEYREMKERFADKAKSAREKRIQLERRQEELLSGEDGAHPWMEKLRECRDIDHLDRTQLAALINHITVNSKDSIEIQFRYEDEMEEFMREMAACGEIGSCEEADE